MIRGWLVICRLKNYNGSLGLAEQVEGRKDKYTVTRRIGGLIVKYKYEIKHRLKTKIVINFDKKTSNNY